MAPRAGTAGWEFFNCGRHWGQSRPYILMRGEGDPVTPDDHDVNVPPLLRPSLRLLRTLALEQKRRGGEAGIYQGHQMMTE